MSVAFSPYLGGGGGGAEVKDTHYLYAGNSGCLKTADKRGYSVPLQVGEGGGPLSQQTLNLKSNFINFICPIPSPGKPAQTSHSLFLLPSLSFWSCLLKINISRLQKHDWVLSFSVQHSGSVTSSTRPEFVAKVPNTSQANFLLLFIGRAKHHGCIARS